MSDKKKPFRETGVGRFLIEKAPSILGMVGDAILPGNVISELISGNSQLSEADKQVALEKFNKTLKYDAVDANVLESLKKLNELLSFIKEEIQ